MLAAVGPTHGTGLKEVLEGEHGEPINHGRLYPNLDELVAEGYIVKGQRDSRTNEYELTESGTETDPEHVPSNVRKSVYITFLQSHTETLEDANIVRTDDRGTMIFRGDAFEHAYEGLKGIRDTFGFRGEA